MTYRKSYPVWNANSTLGPGACTCQFDGGRVTGELLRSLWKGSFRFLNAQRVSHFRPTQIRIFQAINNHVNAVVQAVELYSHLLSIRSFPEGHLDRRGSQSIFTPDRRFKVTSFPIWS